MSYIKNILLSVDVEKKNAVAVAYSVELAKQLGTKIHILYSYQILLPASEIDFIDISAIEEGMRRDAKEKLNQIKKDFFYSDSLSYEFLLKPGAVESNIETTIQEKSIDLLIMGTSGPHGLLEILGSHTTNIIHQVKIPILAIPEKAVFSTFRNILYACDLKRLSIHLDLLLTIAKKNQASLHILTIENRIHFLNVNAMITDRIVDHILSDAEHHYSKGEDLENTILSYTEKNNINLLAVTPHHHSLWERINQRSVSKKLLFHSNIPLLILPE
jgi:nucleotide-binding universal stress UspA family protein